MIDLIDQSVHDPTRALRVKSLMQEIVIEAKQSYPKRRQADRNLYELIANSNATPELLPRSDEINNAHMRSSTKILGLRCK